GVLGQEDVAALEPTRLAVRGLDLDVAVEKQDELPLWGEVPAIVIVRPGLAEVDLAGRDGFGERPDGAGVPEGDLDVFEVGLPVGGGVDAGDSHGLVSGVVIGGGE